jgi:16S rRNA (adenine1518-N6/adenine1519-N6)-dimethyltransferase
MQTLSEIRAMLNERGIRPRKSLGQNFLIDQNLIRRLVDASGAAAGDLVLEIGPGTGTLTEELLARGCRVVACELDDALAALLADRLADEPRFTLVRGDCLAGKRALNPSLAEAVGDGPFRLVANLPYGAGTPLLLVLMSRFANWRSFHVTVQREVGERLLAGPGEEAYGSISVVAALSARLERIATLGPACFWPRPGVESVMIGGPRLDHPGLDLAAVAETAQVLFTQRRRLVGRACRNLGLALPEGIDPGTRVCALTPESVACLSPGGGAR